MERNKWLVLKKARKDSYPMLYDLVMELRSWCVFSDEALEQAKKSKIGIHNSKTFEVLQSQYVNRDFDANIDVLADILKILLKK
jgi:hypothetical protein